jgi:hypothetical protein
MIRSLFLALTLATLALASHAPAAKAQGCPAPTSLMARNECGGVRLGWLGTRLGTGWRVFRAAPHATAVAIGTVSTNTFFDTTAQPGVLYQYAVQQFGGACGTTSPFAGPVEGQNDTPEIVTGITAADSATCVVRVTWNAVPGATAYRVVRSPSEDDEDGDDIGTTALTAFDDSTAQPGVPYWYWVSASSSASCLGAFPPSGEPGGLKPLSLPDLRVDTGAAGIWIDQPVGSRHAISFGTGVSNLGTAPLLAVTKHSAPDGTADWFQRFIGCDGNLKERYLGRFAPQPDGEITFPHLVRVRLRYRGLNEEVLEALAEVDLPAQCLRDEVRLQSLPGGPATPQFTSCIHLQKGLSIGWASRWDETEAPNLDLGCVWDGRYWIEHVVDPDDLIRELDETNNVYRVPIVLSDLPQPTGPPDCFGPPIVSRLIGPDTMVVAAGATSDSIVVRVWSPDVTDSPGPAPLSGFAEFGYVSTTDPHSLMNGGTWAPAQWRRQDGSEDIYGATISIPTPGNYRYSFRFRDEGGNYQVADLDGSQNGFSTQQAGLLHVRATTGVGDAPGATALAFGVIANGSHAGTRFTLTLPEATSARIAIHDVLGRRVRSIAAGELAAGAHAIDWDETSDEGMRVRPGIYFARLETSRGGRLVARWVHTP